uniref:hypothetical protein n=1 Tax=Pseudonocardia sp. CA-138482 TaxID=3240023 RepID=UPI003F49A9EA
MIGEPTHQEVIEKARTATRTALAQARAHVWENDAEAALTFAENVVRFGALLRIFNAGASDLDNAALLIGSILGSSDAERSGLTRTAVRAARRLAALDALVTLLPYLNPVLVVAALAEGAQ